MTIVLTRVFLGVSALVFTFIGLNTLADPMAAMAPLELLPKTVSGLNEARANYGGLQIGVAALLLAGALHQHWRRPALWVSLAVTGGLLAGRLISLVVDGSPSGFLYGLVALESASSLVAVLLLWFGRGSAQAQ